LFCFTTKSSNTSWLKVFFKGKITQGHNCITKHFSQLLSTNWMGKWFLEAQISSNGYKKSLQKKMCNIIFFWKFWVSYNGFVKKVILHIFFGKDIWPQKNLKLHLHSLHVFSLHVHFFLNCFTLNPWSTSKCFFNVVIPLLLKYKTRLFFNMFQYYMTYWSTITQHTMHDLWHFNIN
jgi:hypothetical protein